MTSTSEPTFEEAGRQYTSIIEEVKKALPHEKFGIKWEGGVSDPVIGVCGPTRVRGSYGTGGDAAVPDARWPELIDQIAQVLKPHGFTHSGVVANQPGVHNEVFRGPFGATFEVGAQKATTLGITGGCFREEHPKTFTPPSDKEIDDAVGNT